MDTSKSMLDVAYDLVVAHKKEMTFTEIFEAVAAELKMSEEEKKNHLGAFYTELTLDGRFVAMTDNVWDLRARHTYDKVHIDVNDVYSDVEEGDEDEEDEQEEKEYNAEIEGKPLPDNEPEQAPEDDSATVEEKPAEVDVDSLVGK